MSGCRKTRGENFAQTSGWGHWVDRGHGPGSKVLEGENYFCFFGQVGLKHLRGGGEWVSSG